MISILYCHSQLKPAALGLFDCLDQTESIHLLLYLCAESLAKLSQHEQGQIHYQHCHKNFIPSGVTPVVTSTSKYLVDILATVTVDLMGLCKTRRHLFSFANLYFRTGR